MNAASSCADTGIDICFRDKKRCIVGTRLSIGSDKPIFIEKRLYIRRFPGLLRGLLVPLH